MSASIFTKERNNIMKLHELQPAAGSRKPGNRVNVASSATVKHLVVVKKRSKSRSGGGVRLDLVVTNSIVPSSSKRGFLYQPKEYD